MAPNTTNRNAGRLTRVVLAVFPLSRRFRISLAIEIGLAPLRFPFRVRLVAGGLLHLSVELVEEPA